MCRFRASADQAFHLPNPEPHYAPDLGLEPVHVDVALGFDLAGRQAAGAVTTTVLAHRDGLRSLTLDAVSFLDVDVVDPDGHDLTFRYDGERLHITWAEALHLDERRRVEVRYRVIDPLTGMTFSWPDDVHPDRPRFCGTDHETERARYWLPCVDHPSVRTPLDLHLRAGSEYTILANGLETEREEHDDGTTTSHWHLEQPCPSYLVCLAIGEFVRADGRPVGDVEVAAFASPPFTSEEVDRSFGRTSGMLEWMTAKLASPFPFPKYFQVALHGIGGAMENISLVTWDDKFVADETFAAEQGWLIDLINVHEMAHSWFGDAIVCRDFSHVWLKESWATYMESCWLEDVDGVDAMHFQLSEESRAYRTEADRRYVRPIVTRSFDSSWDMYDQHLYPGGAFRLHMLRCELGDDDFWAGVRDYVRLFGGRTVETSDFRRTLEARSGRSLARFFDQWLHAPGYPRLEGSFSWSDHRSEATVAVEQKQHDPATGVPLFHFELEVDLETTPGEWITRTLQVDTDKHSLVVPLAARPRQVVIDPRGKLLHSLKWKPGRDLLGRTLRHGPTVPGRIQAARALARTGGRRSIELLREAYAAETFWGVRIEIARALGAAGSRAAASALASLLAVEEDPRVMRFVTETCGRYRDEGIAQALVEWLARDDVPYLARRKALESLGRQRGEDHLETLRAAALDRGWWGWVRQGALLGLGQTRTEEARQFLVTRATANTELRQVRLEAIAALAQAALWQDVGGRARTLEVLADLTRDVDYGIRMAALRAMPSLRDGAALGVMEGAMTSLAEQDRPRIRRLARGLRKELADGGSVVGLRKQVEDLTERFRKLQHRLEKLEQRERADDDLNGDSL